MPVKGSKKPELQKQKDWEIKVQEAEKQVEDTLSEMSSEIVIRNPSIFEGRIPPEQKLYAAVAYTVTGSSRKAAALWLQMFPDSEDTIEKRSSTLRMWKREAKWWDEAVRATWAGIGNKVQSKISKIIQTSLDATQERLEHGDAVVLQKTGELIYKPVSAKDAATTAAIMIDKQQLLQGNPTSRVEKLSSESMLEKLRKEFAESGAKIIEGEVLKDA